MNRKQLLGGAVHDIPADLSAALQQNEDALQKWEGLTALARNEWICWTISVKQQKTRDNHVRRVVSELHEGIRRPCCWIGCIHRTDKKISPSVQWAMSRRAPVKSS